MSQLEKTLKKLTGKTIKQVGTSESGERLFSVDGRVMTHSEINARFSLA